MTGDIERLIAASSLGTPEAVALRESVPDEVAARIVARSKELGAAGHVEQPMPTPNDRPSVQGMVRADLEVRERVGIQRYGTPLQPFNNRDALRDAYEEALDLACYLRQAIAERDHAAPSEADNLLRGLMAAASLSRDEAAEALSAGRFRVRFNGVDYPLHPDGTVTTQEPLGPVALHWFHSGGGGR